MSRRTMRKVPILFLLQLFQCKARSNTCNNSVVHVVEEWPSMQATLNAWIVFNNRFTEQLVWTNISCTFMLASDDVVTQYFLSHGAGTDNTNTSATFVATSLHFALPGDYCLSDLLKAKRVTSLLGEILDLDLSWEFKASEDGKSVMASYGNITTRLVHGQRACGSMVYLLDNTEFNNYGVDDSTILEAMSTLDLSRRNGFRGSSDCHDNERYFVDSQHSDAVTSEPDNHCNISIAQMTSSWPDTQIVFQGLNLFQNTLTKQLKWTNISVTVFITTDDVLNTLLGAKGLAAALTTQTSTRIPLLFPYLTLPGDYCISDLLNVKNVTNLLGHVMGMDIPLEFRLSDGGDQVILSTPDFEASIVYSTRACQSMLYVIDNITIPEVFDTIDIHAFSDAIDKIDISHLDAFHTSSDCQDNTYYTNGTGLDRENNLSSGIPTTQADTDSPQHAVASNAESEKFSSSNVRATPETTESASTSTASLSTAVIVGIAVAAIVLLLVVAVIGLLLWRRRRSLQLPNEQTKDPAVNGSCTPESTMWGSCADKQHKALKMHQTNNHEVVTASFGTDCMPISLNSAVNDDTVKGCFDNMPREWVVRDVDIIKQVASGSFGDVYVGRWNDILVAVKQFSVHKMDTDEERMLLKAELKAMQKEVSIMSGLRHPNVVLFLGVLTDPPSVVMEYCHHGSLFRVLRKAEHDPTYMAQLEWKRRVGMALDVAKGMLFLHSREVPIIHRDLKSANLLVDKAWGVKVSDFGLSKIVDLASSARTTIPAMNPRWLAPEVINVTGKVIPFTPASDVYAFGIVLWELLTCEEPFKGLTPAVIIFGVAHRGDRPEIPAAKDLPGDYAYGGFSRYLQLMQNCWHQDPEQRPTFKTITEELGKIRQQALEMASSRGLP